MKFSYTALTSDNQQVNGVLDLETRDAAQAELHKMGVAILSLNEISDEEYEKLKNQQQADKAKKGIQTFSFVGIDPQQKEIKGTIDADNAFSAYKRLRQEYHFQIKELYIIGADENTRFTQNAQLAQFESQLPQTQQPNSENQINNEEQEAALNQELIKGVDQMIANVKKALIDYQDLFSQEMTRTIQNKLGELERIRTSNNVKHVTDLSEEIYRLIQNPDLINQSDNKGNYQTFIKEISNSSVLDEKNDLYKKAIQVTGAKNLFKRITQKLKKLPQTETLVETEPQPSFFEKIKTKITSFKKQKALQDFKPQPITTQAAPELTRAQPDAQEERRDLTFLFVEIDSFIAWLLTFYILYFFMVNFSIEKGIGLNQEFVLKTIKNPLILDITLLLFVSHFILRVRNQYLRHHVVANLFLFFFAIGFYTFVIINY